MRNLFSYKRKIYVKKSALFRSRSGSCSWLSPKEVSKVPFIYYVSTWWSGGLENGNSTCFLYWKYADEGGGGLKNLKMCLRIIWMVPKDDVLSFLVCWGLCRRLGTLETLMLWWKFSLDLGQYNFTTYAYGLSMMWQEKHLGKTPHGLGLPASLCVWFCLEIPLKFNLHIFMGRFLTPSPPSPSPLCDLSNT